MRRTCDGVRDQNRASPNLWMIEGQGWVTERLKSFIVAALLPTTPLILSANRLAAHVGANDSREDAADFRWPSKPHRQICRARPIARGTSGSLSSRVGAFDQRRRRMTIGLSLEDTDTAKVEVAEPARWVEPARILLPYREDPSFAAGRGLHHQTVQRPWSGPRPKARRPHWTIVLVRRGTHDCAQGQGITGIVGVLERKARLSARGPLDPGSSFQCQSKQTQAWLA